MLQALAAYDPLDPASADVPVPDYRAALCRQAARRHDDRRDPPLARAGRGRRLRPGERAVADLCRGVRCGLPHAGTPRRAPRRYPGVAAARFRRRQPRRSCWPRPMRCTRRDFRERPHLFGRHMFARIGLGAFLRAADYIEAVRQRRELCSEMAEALAGVDAIVSANATGPAPRIDAVGITRPSSGRRTRRRTTSPDCRRCRCRSGSRTGCRWHSRSPPSRSRRPRCCAPAMPSSRPATFA